MGKIVFFLLSAMCAIPLSAQTFCGEHKFDGQHRNEVSGYVMAGTNVVTKGFGGISASYKRHLTDRWNVEGKMQMQFGKQLLTSISTANSCGTAMPATPCRPRSTSPTSP